MGFIAKALSALCLSILLLPITVIPASAADIEIYVSPAGNDAWTGDSPEKPFRTLEKARDAVRMIKERGYFTRPVAIILRGGLYELDKPFVLTVEDSGTETTPVTYRAYQGEKPVISGGKTIDGTWRRYKGMIMVCDIPEVKEGKWYFRQLFNNGKRMTRSRMPNYGEYTVRESKEELGRDSFKFGEGDIRPWRNLNDAEVIVFHSWNESRLRIQQLFSDENIVRFTGRIGGRLGANGTGHNRYYVENTLEGIDQPGEWYLDRNEGKLYFWIPSGISALNLRAPVITQLVRLDGDVQGDKYVSYVNFEGLTFADQDYWLPPEGIPTIRDVGDIYKPSAITFEGAAHCRFENNTVRNTGTYALEVTGYDNLITGNKIHDTGSGGIITRSYHPERNVFAYNHIFDCGQIFHSAVGINVDDGGGHIAHNLIHNISHTGVYGRHWASETQKQERRNQEQGLIIEYNEIYDVCLMMNDGAGIFIRDSNIIIRNNLIHDVWSYLKKDRLRDSYNYGGTPGWGIYLGCETRDTKVENNVVFRVREAMHIWQGNRNNLIENNVFDDAGKRHIRYENPRDRNHENIRFLRNIVCVLNPETELFNISGERSLPVESDYNLFFRKDGDTFIIKGVEGITSLADWKAKGFDAHSASADPLFTDPANGDYSLRPESPAFRLGIKPIDLSNVGLRGRK